MLFWEQGLRSELQMRSPLKVPKQQNNRQQDKTRADVENKGLGNYWHPHLKPAWGKESGKNVSQIILETILQRNAFDKLFCLLNKRESEMRLIDVCEVLHHKAERTQLSYICFLIMWTMSRHSLHCFPVFIYLFSINKAFSSFRGWPLLNFVSVIFILLKIFIYIYEDFSVEIHWDLFNSFIISVSFEFCFGT